MSCAIEGSVAVVVAVVVVRMELYGGILVKTDKGIGSCTLGLVL